MNELTSHGLLGISMREMPHNMPAEQALLGAIMANNNAYERVSEFLLPEHFIDPIHARIYQAIAKRVGAGETADPVVLRRDFENSGILDEVGGVGYLAQLLMAMVGIINAGDYGRAIYDAWLRRELINECVATIERSFSPDGMAGQDILESLDAGLTQITGRAGGARPLVTGGDAVKAAVELSMIAAQRSSNLAGITTGYRGLNRVTGGLMPGQYYLLGARPAMGKSGLTLGISARAASAGLNVLHWSGEMAAAQNGTRLAAAHAGIDVMSVFRGKGYAAPEEVKPNQPNEMRQLTTDEWDRLIGAQRDAASLPLWFDDRPGLSVAGLRQRARRMKRAKKLDLLVVDYVGLMRASPIAEKQKLYERMTEISIDLARLAAELEIPVVVAAQLNRDVEKRENKMPILADLRDSGALEQDAYCVLFLHRPHYYLVQAGLPVQRDKETAEAFADRTSGYYQQLELTKELAVVNVAKNRNGPTGPVRMKFNAETIWFRDEGEPDGTPAWGGNLALGAD